LIVVIVASKQENRFLEKRISVKNRSIHGGTMFLEGLLGGKKILTVKSGVGPKKAKSAAKQILKRCLPSVVISIGAAGALDPKLSLGDCVVVGNILRISKNLQKEEKKFNCDEAFSQKALSCIKTGSSSVTKGDCLTTRAFIHLKDMKKSLFSTYNAQAIDMESSALAEVFCSEKIPFIGIRIISDTADHDVIDMNLLHEIKRSYGISGIILHFIKNPKEFISAWRFRIALNRASIQIGEITETLVREL
jgi:adenosylhomocysteine nucleosidase